MRALPEGDRRRVGKSPAHLHKQDSTDLPLSDDTYNPKDSSQRRPMRKVHSWLSSNKDFLQSAIHLKGASDRVPGPA